MTVEEKTRVIEKAVLFSTPETLEKLFDDIGAVDNMNRALGLACHFRGVEWVKVLVENGAVFKEGKKGVYNGIHFDNPNGVSYYDYQKDFSFSLLDPKFWIKVMTQKWKGEEGIARDSISAFGKVIDSISEEERLECVRYFIELDDSSVCNLQDLLYYAIVHCDYKVVELLRQKGLTIPQVAVDILINGYKANMEGDFWFYTFNLSDMTVQELMWIISELSKDLESGKLITSNYYFIYSIIYEFSEEPWVFDYILSHFDNKKINKKKAMELIISMEKPGLLAVCEKHGWLKMPRKRDEMIKFASDNNKTECTAWLLDFKKRTADLKAEQEKAEKKLMRELNADPNSITELKKLWAYEKRSEGGIVLTRYKGKHTKVIVPEKIGKDIVREIGEYAFSPDAKRLTKEQAGLRLNITKIVLPETVEVIGKYAFCECEKLSSVNIPKAVRVLDDNVFFRCFNLISVNIPNGVGSIGENTFYACKKLSEINIPSSVTEIGTNAFSGCVKLTSAVLSEGITKIGNGCFSSCENLKKVASPPTVKEIGTLAFWGCSELEEITIPEGVCEIGEKVFADCPKLRSVILPKSVKLIKNSVLKGEGTKNIFSEWFAAECKDLTVTVPADSYAEEYCKSNNINYIIMEEEK